MKPVLIAYGAVAAAMLVLDLIWLSLTAERLYRAQIGTLMRPGFALAPAIFFYFIYVFGITILAVQPTLSQSHVLPVLWRGALLGFVAYATYDLTNQATLKTWPIGITVADMCWGTFLTAAAASFGWWVTRLIAPVQG